MNEYSLAKVQYNYLCRPKKREVARFNWIRYGLVYSHIKYPQPKLNLYNYLLLLHYQRNNK